MTLTRSIVTKKDVLAGLRAVPTGLSDENPANFIKDVIRGNGANRMWPEALKLAHITARQVTGDGNCWEFLPYKEDQTEPFPSIFGHHESVEDVPVQSISIPLATKALGRDDETYLIQVAVKLLLVETHMAIKSPLRIIEAGHLQTGIKQSRTEIDSFYYAKIESDDGQVEDIVMTCEAKKRNQRILTEQVVQQVRAAFELTEVGRVVPLAMTGTKRGVYIAEFAAITRAEVSDLETLTLQSEAHYILTPPVQGVNANPKRRIRKPRKPAQAESPGPDEAL